MRTRPSELIGLDPEDKLTCFLFDRAINAFGDSLSAELRDIDAKSKKEHQSKVKKILLKWLPEASRAGQPRRDPAKRSG